MAKKRKRKSRSTVSSKRIDFTAASSSNYCGCCCHGSKNLGWLFLILGILYLFTDLGWMRWWSVSWWTILFLLMGFWWVKK